MNRALLTAALLGGAALASQAAAQRSLPAQFELGRDADNDVCSARRSWSEGGQTRVEALQPFVIVCRPSAQARGYMDPPAAAPRPVADALCGETRVLSVEGLGEVRARRCRDPRLGREALDLTVGQLHAAGVPTAAGPLLAALRMAQTGAAKPNSADDPNLKVLAALAGAPAGVVKTAPGVAAAATGDAASGAASVAGAELDSAGAVQLGLRLIYEGRNVEASRLLNDAVAQFAGAPALQRAELRLNAALADSNIGEFGAANAHLMEASASLSALPSSPTLSALMGQLGTYRALHLGNMNRWNDALAALDARELAAAPLTDIATLAVLNRSEGGRLAAGLDTASANALLLAVQRDTVRSIAESRLGRPDEAQASLARAVVGAQDLRAILDVQAPGSEGGVAWLRARLERQRARLAVAGGRWDEALAGYDCAIATMQAVTLPAGCLFADGARRRDPLTGPVIAEVQLERADALESRGGTARAVLLAQYRDAVDTLAASAGSAAVASPRLARYLDLLAADAARGDRASAAEYFRAVQLVREPSIALEYAALESAVSGGRTGGLIRERQELGRRETQLRYEIAGLQPGSQRLAEAQAERVRIGADLDRVRGELAATGAYAAVDDAPVTLAALQGALLPGETYLKLVRVGPRLFGAAVTREDVAAYAVEGAADEVTKLADAVLTSARSYRGPNGALRLRPFAVTDSLRLFRRVAGPAGSRLATARSVMIDVGGVLGGLPASVLVVEPSAPVAKANDDHGRVAFLGRRAELATALSPNAFMRVRTALKPSTAPNALIGFGDNAVAQAPGPGLADALVPLGAACRIRYADWVDRFNGNRPIPADEIRAAAVALGAPDAPVVTGADFTDIGVAERGESGELARYQVLHFATHGIPAEEVPGLCDTPLPPSLITSIQPPDPANGPDQPIRSDGLLSYVDVARLRLDANLVVLSACETASGVGTVAGRLGGQEESAPTLDGLVRAFIVAQARAVVATYWRVPARAGTEALIAEFYRAGRTGTIGGALRQAQATVAARPETSHPYFWAAFFLVGDGAKSMLSSPDATKVASR